MSVQDVDSNFSWKWYLKDLKDISKKNIKVFSCFSCGGGSSMGYKRNGFEVVGCCEIDPKIAEVYKKNLNPKYLFVEDIRKFNQRKNEDLPKELLNLDILDGSPPCSTFSLAGLREDAWGKQKKFREGQEFQTLDDLCFEFIKTAKKLKPKIVILENVKGLIIGNAKKYATEIIRQFKEIGYEVQVFLLNSKYMDVPQARERVFFIANNQKYPKLKLNFNNKIIPYKEIRCGKTKPSKNTMVYKYASKSLKNASEACKKEKNKASYFCHQIVDFNKPLSTITATMDLLDPKTLGRLSWESVRNGSSFPQDYNFGDQSPYFICGMSVPPNMLANISKIIYKQWLER
jgi:DNA (cytosine-5)-methyltransferase 1